jgi:hypothetical protein
MIDEYGRKTEKFPFDPRFMIAIISKAKSEEELFESIGFVPKIDKFHKIIV